MSAYDEYAKSMKESGELLKEAQDLSTKAQLDQIAESKKLAEAEKQIAYRGAYVDYAKNINPYGVQSELAYGSGLGGSGKGETAQANYYNTYQNRLGEINTNTTNVLRDLTNQETNVRIAGDQAKLSIDTQVGQQLAAAQREDTLRAEQYAREDMVNNKNFIVSMISSTGYNPTDEELAAAGMTRGQADALRQSYQRSLYSKSSSSSGSSSYDRDAIYKKMAKYKANGDIDGAYEYMDQFGDMSDDEWMAIGTMYFGDDWLPAEQETSPHGNVVTVDESAKGTKYMKTGEGNKGKDKSDTATYRYVWSPTQKKYIKAGLY